MHISQDDIWLFKEGKHNSLYNKLGAHIVCDGVHFSVWAPNATSIWVIGDFNGWKENTHLLNPRNDDSGIWEGFVAGAKKGDKYKYKLISHSGVHREDKSDPFAIFSEPSPGNSSIIWDLEYEWRAPKYPDRGLNGPISVYEIHLPSWRRVPEENNRPLSYKELAAMLPQYLQKMGFTHVEFLPVMEHPFYGSWGYQTVGYFAPSSLYGTPQDFMNLIDTLHEYSIGVILDWVPSHFPSDSHGIAYFDGTHLYEHEDYRKRVQPDWNTYLFNYDYPAIRSFLISAGSFWFDKYHIDGLRIDAVASMLYLDYSKPNAWLANQYGGRENIGAILFLQDLNKDIHAHFPHALMIAEESTSWANVSRPTYTGGLGFDLKWNMGWMHDILEYMQTDPNFRKHQHNKLLFSLCYAHSENFILPLSHDEVVYGKHSLLEKMPGDLWQKCANLRLLFGYMYTHPGKKLVFMGSEFGQHKEWNHDASLDWHLVDSPEHVGIQRWMQELNQFYKQTPALYEIDFSQEGFEWIDTSDSEQSIISFLRKSKTTDEHVLVICNFTPIVHHHYKVDVPYPGLWKMMLNSDELRFGGSGIGCMEMLSHVRSHHSRPFSVELSLPPFAICILKFSGS